MERELQHKEEELEVLVQLMVRLQLLERTRQHRYLLVKMETIITIPPMISR